MDLGREDGEFIVLVGPSGCGKKTALRMAAGLEEITDGEIRIGERVVNHVPPRDRDIAMVFQSYALYPHLTVRDPVGWRNSAGSPKPSDSPGSHLRTQASGHSVYKQWSPAWVPCPDLT